MEEAHRIASNAARMRHYHGTTTKDVVESLAIDYHNRVFCYGELREFVFTKITDNVYAFKTVAKD